MGEAESRRPSALSGQRALSEFAKLGLSADAKIALVYARRHGAISNEDLRNLRGLDRDASRAVLQDLVARGLLDGVGRGRGARYILGSVARRTASEAALDDQLRTVLRGVVANSDVRGLLDVDPPDARAVLMDSWAGDCCARRGSGG